MTRTDLTRTSLCEGNAPRDDREAALRRSQAELKAIYDHAPVMMCVVDANRHVLYANRAFAAFTGSSEEELVGGRACGVFGCINAADDLQGCGFGNKCEDCGFRLALEDTLATGIEYRDLECQARWARQGAVQRVDLLASTALIQTDSEPRVLLCLHDMTERMQTEKAIRESEGRFRQMADTAPVLMWMSGPDKGCTFFNQVWLNFTGRALEQEVGNGWASGVHPDDFQRCLGIYCSHFDARQPFEMDYRLRRADGAFRWVHDIGVPRFDSTGDFLGFIGSCIDVTDRKQAEEVVRAHEQLLSAIFENAKDSIFVKDASLRYVTANSSTASIFGFRVSDMLGKSDAELWDPAIVRQIEEEDRRVLLGETVEAYASLEVNAKAKHVHTIKVPLKDESGRVSGLCGISRDVTERHLAELEKTKLEAQLQQAKKLESVGLLAGGIAHDFNNMLGAILGYTNLAIEQVDPSHLIHANLLEVRKAAERSAELTRQLLAFARKQTVAPRLLDLNEALAPTINLLQRLVSGGIQITWQPDAGPCPVWVDPVQLDQILTNLCINARDAISDVGHVSIRCRSAAFDAGSCAEHAGIPDGAYVVLAVSDDGCGMDEETTARVFEPFFTTKPVGKGTGLGLPTVYGAVKQSNGFIKVDSTPGHGTRFTIYLPRAEGPAEQQAMSRTAPSPRRGRETVLLVEDQPTLLKLYTAMLEQLGYKVWAAPGPRHAIRLMEEHTDDIRLLVTDVVMPEMNGAKLAIKLRRAFPGIRQLFISGYASDVIAQHNELREGVTFLEKPFTKDALAAKVREALDSDGESLDGQEASRPPTGPEPEAGRGRGQDGAPAGSGGFRTDPDP